MITARLPYIKASPKTIDMKHETFYVNAAWHAPLAHIMRTETIQTPVHYLGNSVQQFATVGSPEIILQSVSRH